MKAIREFLSISKMSEPFLKVLIEFRNSEMMARTRQFHGEEN